MLKIGNNSSKALHISLDLRQKYWQFSWSIYYKTKDYYILLKLKIIDTYFWIILIYNTFIIWASMYYKLQYGNIILKYLNLLEKSFWFNDKVVIVVFEATAQRRHTYILLNIYTYTNNVSSTFKYLFIWLFFCSDLLVEKYEANTILFRNNE